MALKVLFTGSSRAASWEIRGRQLGGALGADVYRDATPAQIRQADVVVAVKRVDPKLAEKLLTCGRLVVWDALDFFQQMDRSGRPEMVRKTRERARAMGARHVLGATRQMAEDVGSLYSLVHHGWDRGRAEIRDEIRVVAYEGADVYLGSHREWIEQECSRRGYRFVVNPGDYLQADVVLATRGPEYDSYATRNWKSGLKLSNAQVAGIPFVGRREAGYMEQSSGAERWADSRQEFSDALDSLESREARQAASETMHSVAPHLPAVADHLRRILEEIAR